MASSILSTRTREFRLSCFDQDLTLTFRPNARLVGYQIILGIGIGGALQNTIVAIQAEFAGPDREHLIPQTTATIGWSQLLGGIVGLAIAGTVFANGLSKFLPVDLDHGVRVAVRQSVNAVFELPLGQKELVVKVRLLFPG